jgi:hypothetical protein
MASNRMLLLNNNLSTTTETVARGYSKRMIAPKLEERRRIRLKWEQMGGGGFSS